MKILIVSGIFYPEQTPRTYRTSELAIQFARLGHDVTIVVPGGVFDFDTYSQRHNIRVLKYSPVNYKTNFTGIGIVNRIFARVLKQYGCYPHITIVDRVYKLLKDIRKDYDIIVSIAAPHAVHWAVAKLYRKGIGPAKKWIADCGDPFMLNATESFRPPFYFKSLEKSWCSRCDFITVPTDTSYKGYYPEFKSKIRIIPQAFNFDEVELGVYNKHDVPTFAFSGAFILNRRDPRPFLDYLIANKKKFKAIFYTKQNGFLEKYKQYGDMIEIRDYVPRLQLLKDLSEMDFLLNLENGTSVQTPSKLIDYALTRRPILSVDSQNLDIDTINQFFDGDYSNCKRIDNIDRYNIKIVANQFLSL